MKTFFNANRSILVITLFVMIAIYLLEAHKGFSLWDEGFLWYGVQGVLQGEIPLRDFMSYDPGRYLWSAFLLKVFNADDSILNTRIAVYAFQSIGLFIYLKLIQTCLVDSKQTKSLVIWIFSIVLYVMWAMPRHKLFDVTLSICLIYTIYTLIKQPSVRQYFISGLIIGLTAFFGRNHGVYGVFALMMAIMWNTYLVPKHLNTLPLLKVIIFSLIGIVIGYSPIILMLLLVPSFYSAFIESILFLFSNQATNISIPIIWPWAIPLTQLAKSSGINQLILSTYFISLIAFPIGFVVYQLKNRKNATPSLLVATAIVAIPYAHYAFSRADVGHLALGIFPALVGIIFLASKLNTKACISIFILMLVSTTLLTKSNHPFFQCFRKNSCVKTEVNGDQLWVDKQTAFDIVLLRKLDAKFSPNGEQFIAVPYWPGAYALLEKRSPLWEIYPLFKRNERFEHIEIERLKKAKLGFVLILDKPLDGNLNQRFALTHPLTTQYIKANFTPIKHNLNKEYQLFKLKE